MAVTTEGHKQTERLNGAADRVQDAATRVLGIVKVLGAVLIVMLVFQFALQWQILQLDDKLDQSTKNTSAIAASTVRMQQQIDELQKFTEEVREETPQEQTNSDAIQRAVALVPTIVQILCEQSPDVPSCQGG
jgi:peptidoglycan hydrolase CwlO-like protein